MLLKPSWTANTIALKELYQGHCFSLPPQSSSQRLGDTVREVWSELFGCAAADVHKHYQNAEILHRLKALRQRLYHSDIRKLQCAMAIEAGLTGEHIWIDALRIRVLTPQMLQLIEAAPVYYAHRDTWYANPIDQVNIWMPLNDVLVEESFELYPSYFQRPIKNSSHAFDYSYFSSHVGWQSSRASGYAHAYPEALEDISGPRLSIEGAADSMWCFSGQHLHQSCRGQTSTRVSIDFRCLPHSRLFVLPQNVDNESFGSTRSDFFCMETSNLLA